MKKINTYQEDIENALQIAILNAISNRMEFKEGNEIYHYTNIEALYRGILVNPRTDDEKGISIFATDHRYLNDDNEVRFGCEKINKIADKYIKYDKTKAGKIVDDSKSRYIISFSMNSDSIPMWSTYGKKGDGIVLGFDLLMVQKELRELYPCLYNDSQIESFLHTILSTKGAVSCGSLSQEMADMETMFRLLNSFGLMSNIVKHPSYEYENEFRYVSSSTDVVNYRYSNNLIIPYKLVYLPKRALKRIIIGPNLNQALVEISVREYIDSIGFTDVAIHKSEVPFRNL